MTTTNNHLLLIDQVGGIEKAKTYAPDRYKSERLKQAIRDVEGGV